MEITRTLGLPFFALTFLGLVHGRRRLFEPENAALGLLTLAIPLAIWVRLSQCGNLNGRYFLLLVFIDAPFTAWGCLALLRWIEQFARQHASRWAQAASGPAILAACLLTAGWAQALASHHGHRDVQARLGKWIGAQGGRFRYVVSDLQSIRPAYIAAHEMPEVVLFDEFYEKRFDRSPPDLAIFYPTWYRPELLPDLIRRAARIGLTPLDQTSFSAAKPEFVIFVRQKVLMLGQRQELGLGAMATALPGDANPLGVQGARPRKAVGMAPENQAVTQH